MVLVNDFKETHPSKLQNTETYKPYNNCLRSFINKLLFTIYVVNLVDVNVLTLWLFTNSLQLLTNKFSTFCKYLFSH